MESLVYNVATLTQFGVGDMYAAMNRRNGVSLTHTIAESYSASLAKALDMGLDMSVWLICRV